MRRVFGASRLGTGVGSVVALLGVLFLGAVPATAGIGGGAVPTMPATATIGDLIQTASIIVVNQSTTPNDTETLQLTSLVFTPSCKTGLRVLHRPERGSRCLQGHLGDGK